VILEKLIKLLANLPASSRLPTLHAVVSEYKFKVAQLNDIFQLFPAVQQVLVVAYLMGHVVDHRYLMPWIENALSTKGQLVSLAHEVGPLLTFNPRCPCGHYRLRTTKYHHRIVLKRLQEISSSQKIYRQKKRFRDVSMYGDGEAFRNTKREEGGSNAKKCVLDSCTVIDAVEDVTYEFDFVSMRRPDKNMEVLQDEDFEALHAKVVAFKHEDEQTWCEDEKVSMIIRRGRRAYLAAQISKGEGRTVSYRQMQLYAGIKEGCPYTRALQTIRWRCAAMRANQAALLMSVWPKYSSARIEAYLILYSCVYDEEDSRVLTSLFDPESLEKLKHRIGYVAMWNPCDPDGPYHFDFQYREHRIVANAMIQLAVEEPGENVENETYNGEVRHASSLWVLCSHVGFMLPCGSPGTFTANRIIATTNNPHKTNP